MLGRPAVSAVALFAGGIVLHSIVWAAPIFWILLLAGLLVAAFHGERHARRATFWVATAVICSGIVVGQVAAYQFRTDQIGLFATDEPHLACVELEFSETPRLIEETGPRQLPGRQVGSASVVAVKTWRGWEPASGTVVFSLTHAEPRIVAGQKVRVVGMLQRPQPAMNPGEFDWERYYRHQRVLASIRVNHPFDVQVTSPGASPKLADLREGMRKWLALGFSPNKQADRALLQALMLGDRGPEMRDVERDFQKTGTSHLLASSGLRMAVLASMVYFTCRLVRLRAAPSRGRSWRLGVVAWGIVTLPTPQAAAAGGHRRHAWGWAWRGARTVDAIQLLAFCGAGDRHRAAAGHLRARGFSSAT